MKIDTIIIGILCLILPVIMLSQQWLTAHKLTHLPLILGVVFLLFMIVLTLGISHSIFKWYDYSIIIVLCLYEGWRTIK